MLRASLLVKSMVPIFGILIWGVGATFDTLKYFRLFEAGLGLAGNYKLFTSPALNYTQMTKEQTIYSNRAALQKRKGTMCRRSAGYAAPKVSLYQRVLATARPER